MWAHSSSRVRWKRSALPLVCGRHGRVRRGRIHGFWQVSRQVFVVWAQALSVSARSAVMPRAANQAVAWMREAAQVAAFSSGGIFGVSEPGVIVQGGVEAGGTGAGGVLAAGCAAEDLVTAAVGDAAEFLDVDVDGFARAGVFVVADGLACGPVRGGRGGQVVTDGDAVGRRRRDTAPGGRAGRGRCGARAAGAPPAVRPCRASGAGCGGGGWSGRASRPRRPAGSARPSGLRWCG
jgi:hypothetical protein